MQVMPMNHNNRPLVSVRPQSKVGASKKNNALVAQWLRSLHAYLLTVPVLGLLIKTGKLAWHILAFIISLFASKKVNEQSRATHTRTSVTEEKLHSTAHEYVPETQDHFLVMASHELKTPMTTILGQAQLMLRRLAKMPELSSDLLMMRSGLESIDGQTRRLSALVDDLLDLYNIRAGKVQLRLASCNLVDICREVVAEQSLLTGHTIELKAPLQPVTLQADSDRLRQVLVNLMNNAIKYSPADSPVKMLVEQHRDIGVIEVADSGIGIAKDQQTHIFEPFYRGPGLQTTSKSGMGLGLTICKDIVERHHGRIWLRSRLGRGSTFIVELPLNKRAL